MELQSYRAEELFEWVTGAGQDFTLLDVRNEEEFGRFKVEGPHLSKMINIPYMEFIEKEDESVARVQIPKEESIRIVCAKEGSAKYVGDILAKNGWQDVRYLAEGIKSWGNMLAPKVVASESGYELYQFIRPGKASCHLQADYISGSQQLFLDAGARIVGHENDFKAAAFEYKSLNDQEVFNFSKGGPEIQAIHMPGHTPGSTSYLIDGNYLVSGDTVFILSIGRPDLGGMAEDWAKMLFNTLKTKIAGLDDDLLILPGHYIEWIEANPQQMFVDTLGSIKNKNADIYGIAKEDEFVGFIKDNMRKQPDEYAEIRKVNSGLLEVDDEDQEIMDLGKNECAASMHGK